MIILNSIRIDKNMVCHFFVPPQHVSQHVTLSFIKILSYVLTVQLIENFKNFESISILSDCRPTIRPTGFRGYGSRFFTQCMVIDHLHARENVLITFLIVVTSQLDALVARKNVLQPMGIQRSTVIKQLSRMKHTV